MTRAYLPRLATVQDVDAAARNLGIDTPSIHKTRRGVVVAYKATINRPLAPKARAIGNGIIIEPVRAFIARGVAASLDGGEAREDRADDEHRGRSAMIEQGLVTR